MKSGNFFQCYSGTLIYFYVGAKKLSFVFIEIKLWKITQEISHLLRESF